MIYKLFSLKISGYKYQHKKVNKNIFFILIINYFSHILRAKTKKMLKNGLNILILNSFNIFHINSKQAFELFNNSVGFALSY